MNWMTIAFAVILLWSVVWGAKRRFATEMGVVIAQLISVAVGIAALWAAWVGSARLSNLATHAKVQTLPHVVMQVLQVWQQAPGIARAIVFFIVYLVVSSILNSLLQGLAVLVPRLIPGMLGKSRLLGGGLGAVVGAARVIVLGGLVYVVLQYLSVPILASAAKTSGPYQYLRQTLYDPWIRPLTTRELPVYAQGALEPLSKNINMFVIPTGVGQERGVLVVPKQVSSLAKQIVAGQTTARGKAYALYEWEIHHIHYDWKKYDDYVYHGKWDQQSPLQTLETGKGVCADYALLYADMAHSVGLTVQIDEGLGGTPGQYGSHAWNQVWLPSSQTWIPVDTTWGSQQDAWFDAPNFSQTHIQQIAITISGAGA
ncbi:transglutaminase domain-containing protein [Alicyclobacillus cycloheptanicus]|uniref:Transglutaminase-like domain-containing protein n=1 Tax=Alicyclobacillus cycloheptanicus TaxID=1457 RepID=A0ABT9XJK1_9BACL|nr:transglutaminase domain-containing protein [Alicyclobacillus cycloheptanicus]MDQ0190499.1 hypothetical protein [Alicyclobacillus cycloheptanicus]WDM00739.1 transglutaminase domain-containing protein [Alicyclobacillus cycloheptanicus]